MSRNHKFLNPDGLYFVSFAVTDWIDVFTRREYLDVLLDSLKHCQTKKSMEIYAWVVMSNHIHLVFRSGGSEKPESILGDFKRFTSIKLIDAIKNNPLESPKEWMLELFAKAAESSSNVRHFQFWRHDNKPIELWSNSVIDEKIEYAHNNLVTAGLVEQPEHYLYSSALDYAGGKGLLENVLIAR